MFWLFLHDQSTTSYFWHSPEKNGKVSGTWDENKVVLTLGRSKGVEPTWSLFKFESLRSAGVTVPGAEGPQELGRWSIAAPVLCRDGWHLSSFLFISMVIALLGMVLRSSPRSNSAWLLAVLNVLLSFLTPKQDLTCRRHFSPFPPRSQLILMSRFMVFQKASGTLVLSA